MIKKTVHYRDTVWLQGNNVIEDLLNSAYEEAGEGGSAIVFETYNELSCSINRLTAGDSATVFHLTVFERGGRAAVIDLIRRSHDSVPTNSDGEEYVDTQVFALVSGNDILFISHNRTAHDSRIARLFSDFIRHGLGGSDISLTGFDLVPRFNATRLQEHLNDGIESLDLGLGGFEQTMRFLGDGDGDDGLLSSLKSLFDRRLTPEEIAAAADVKAKLSLKPGRNWKRETIKSMLSSVAYTAQENIEDEGFRIVTKSGVIVTQDSIKLKDDIRVRGDQRLLQTVSAASELEKCFEEMVQENLIERAGDG